MSSQRIFLIAVMPFLASALLWGQNIPDSCGARDWFQLRDKVANGGASLLCKGVVDAAFEHRREAEHKLKEVIRRSPYSNDASAAHKGLIAFYTRHGQYRKALAQIDKALKEKPETTDVKDFRSMIAVLAQSPDLRVVHMERFVVQGEVIDGKNNRLSAPIPKHGVAANILVPITINGISATYIMDTGANFSIMSESEAKRLGVTVHETSTQVADISGVTSATRLAVAPDLRMGKIHLKNIAFMIIPDANEPFVDLPEGHKGILGIPVILALQSFQVDQGNRISVGPPPSGLEDKSVPLAFDHLNPLTQIRFQNKPLTFALDTGATCTDLYKPFADTFPALIETGQKTKKKMTGMFGTTYQEGIDLLSVRFSFAQGVDAELAPAKILLSTPTDSSKWAAGNLGIDLLSQALPVTIDFRAMQMRFGE